MKKILFALSILSGNSFSYAQTNLVPNPSFEIHYLPCDSFQVNV